MKAIISLKTEARIKEQAEQVARQLGIPLSNIMHALLLQFIRDKKVSLDLAEHDLSQQGEALLKDALTDKEEYEFESPAQMIAAANKLEQAK